MKQTTYSKINVILVNESALVVVSHFVPTTKSPERCAEAQSRENDKTRKVMFEIENDILDHIMCMNMQKTLSTI